MTSLYKLTEEYRELENMDLDAETLADTLESLEGEFDAKADAICHVLANIKSQYVSVAAEITRLDKRYDALVNRDIKLKEYLRDSMEKLGKKKIESAKFTISCVAGRDKVNVLDESKIDSIFFSTIPESQKLNKVSLLKVLKEYPDVKVKGAELIKSKSSLRIK